MINFLACKNVSATTLI